MPVKKDSASISEKKEESSRKSPFKEKAELEEEIISFINQFKTTIAQHANRMSDFFEISCYNLIVKYYELHSYELEVRNLQGGKYRYKCSPSGIQSNFSYFQVVKTKSKKKNEYEIHHNLSVQSSHDKEIFMTPDISIIKTGKVKNTQTYYDTKRTLSYVENVDLLSFCEAKQFNPFPELVFNFIGIVNELRKEILTNTAHNTEPEHIAPSLMISGKPNKPAEKIKASLENRYCINIIYDIFHSGIKQFSKANFQSLRKAGKINTVSKDTVSSVSDLDLLPF